MILTATGLGKRFGSRWLFRNFGVELNQGDFLVVRGANGSGKSTLLKTIAGLVASTEGSVTLSGDRRTILGYGALDMSVYPHLTPVEHLDMAATLRGCHNSISPEEFGLERCAEIRGSGLSTGQRMRLKIALAVQAKPAILLLDEPGASLDDAGHAMVSQVLAAQIERGCVILATNSTAEGRGANLEFRLDS